MGIYSAEARTLGGSSPIVNAEFKAESSLTSSAFSALLADMIWGTANTAHTFYAYYPYTAGSAANTVVPVSLASAQTQSAAGSSAHIGALDFMVATPVTVTSPATPGMVGSDINLRYNHLFTILEFQIIGSGTLKAVKLVGTNNPVTFSGGTIDITQTTPATDVAYTIASQTGATTQAIVTLTSAATLDATTATTVYMVINPGAQTGTCLIGLSDGTTWTYISNAAPTGGFLRGRKYDVSINNAWTAQLKDRDNNNFGIVTIGMQTWMAENLKTTKYNDGTSIPNVTDNSAWAALSTGAYCDYNITPSNSDTYGRLYNWYAVDNNAATKAASNGGKNICPTGWHVPSDTEWTTLTDYLTVNGYGYGGSGSDIAKSMATTSGWTSNGTVGNVGNDQSSNNASGFSALPGGFRYSAFEGIGGYVYWRSSTQSNTSYAWYRHVDNNYSDVYSSEFFAKWVGMSVRCLRD